LTVGQANGRGAEVQAGTGDLHLAQGWTEPLELLHDVADEVRELVDRLGELDQRGNAGLVDAFEPGGDGTGLDEEDAGSLGDSPEPP